jgi:hypothetical protein
MILSSEWLRLRLTETENVLNSVRRKYQLLQLARTIQTPCRTFYDQRGRNIYEPFRSEAAVGVEATLPNALSLSVAGRRCVQHRDVDEPYTNIQTE